MKPRKGETREAYLARCREYERSPARRARKNEVARENRKDPVKRAKILALESRTTEQRRAATAAWRRDHMVGGWELSATICEICGDVADLCRDHDHETGALRGTLCRVCNVHLGRVESGYRPRTDEPWRSVADTYVLRYKGQ